MILMARRSDNSSLNKISGFFAPDWTDPLLMSSLTTGNNDATLTLSKGGTAKYQTITRIRVAAPGAVGDLLVQFFDGAADTTPIIGQVYLNTQTGEGIPVFVELVTGVLGVRITGWASGATKAYLSVSYNYN